MLKHGKRHSNIKLQYAHRSTYEVEEKGENNRPVTESFKLALLRYYKHFLILIFFSIICLSMESDNPTLNYNVLVEELM